MTEEFKVILRDYNKSIDEPYIYSSWRNSWYYSSIVKPKGNPKQIFQRQTQKIKEILEKAQIRIACLDIDPVVIIGYSISRNNHLDWIYVKSDYRKNGIGTMLFPKNIETVTNDFTKIGEVIFKKKYLKTQGEENVRRNSENRQADQRI